MVERGRFQLDLDTGVVAMEKFALPVVAKQAMAVAEMKFLRNSVNRASYYEVRIMKCEVLTTKD